MEEYRFVGGNSHAPATIMREIADPVVWGTYFKWGFVRDPLDRFVSAFFHEQLLTHTFKKTVKGFRDYVHFLYTTGFNFEQSFVGTGHHFLFLPQHYFLCDSKGKIIVDYVGKFSRLNECWDEVLQRLGVSGKLAHKRQSDHAHYSSYYGDVETVKKIKKIYKKDYEIFGDF